MQKIIIDVGRVTFAYEKEQKILQDVSFQVREGESVGLIGANGVGKSTLLKLLVGLYLDYDGDIKIGGQLVQKDFLPQIRSRMGYVFQDSDSQLFLNRVEEEVAFAPRNFGLSEEETAKRVEEALVRTQISHLRDRQIFKLSGGEKKLVSIASVLSMEPEVLLMDEPSIALDPRNRRNLIRLLNAFPQTKLIASHDLDLVLEVCERTILLDKGRIVCEGPTGTILRDGELLETYGLELPLCLQRPFKNFSKMQDNAWKI